MTSDRRPGVAIGLAAAAVLGLATVACNRSNQTSSNQVAPAPQPATNQAAAPTNQPVSLIGCLQEAHGSYILTRVNEPAHPDSSNPSVVAQERLKAAEQAYRLDARDTHTLSKLLGKRVRIEGTVSKASDLVARNGGDLATGTSGRAATAAGRTIKASDLAKVDVTSAQKVANQCGSRSRRVVRRSKQR